MCCARCATALPPPSACPSGVRCGLRSPLSGLLGLATHPILSLAVRTWRCKQRETTHLAHLLTRLTATVHQPHLLRDCDCVWLRSFVMPNRNVVAADGGGGGGGAMDTAAAALNLPTLPPWISRRQRSLVTAGSLSLIGAFLTFVCFNQTEMVIDLLFLEMKSTIGQPPDIQPAWR